jgi:hypothetical protein
MKVRMKLPTLALYAFLTSLAVGCGKEAAEQKWTPEAAELMLYGTQIPLYPGAVAGDAMGSDLYGDTKADHAKGMAIWFDADGTFDELAHWYEARLPEAKQEQTEDGYLVFTLAPQGGADGDMIGVIVENDGKFRIFERVKANRAVS